MRKALLSLAALALMGTANAQLLNYGFETADLLPGEILPTNWENYADANYTYQEPDAFMGQYALGVNTFDTANRWERVIAFFGVPVQPMKSYRVSFMAKGTGTINVGILQGAFYRDMALKAGTADAPVDQLYDKTIANESEWVRVSQMIWSPSLETQQACWTGDTILTEDYFLRLAFTGIGNYKIDNVKIEESSIDKITFNGDAIVVDFGYATNAATLANGNVLLLDPSCVNVNVNGEAAEIDAVEIKKDGQFCIFLAGVELNEEDKVSVSFTNSIGLKYSSTTAPESFETPNAAVYSFEDEVATYDEMLVASSYAYEEAEFVGSNPADDSFELDETLDTFSFTYNKNVLPQFDGDYAVALLTSGNYEEKLAIVESDEVSNTLTFKRTSAEPLVKGIYTITVSNVYNEKGVPTGSENIISFEVGKVAVSQVTYEKVGDGTFEGCDGNYPLGWTMRLDKGVNEETGEADIEIRQHTDAGGFGQSRGFTLTNSTVAGAIYMRYLDWSVGEGNPSMSYGDMEGYELQIPAGNVEVRILSAGWDGSGGTMKAALYKESLDGEEVASQEITVATGNNSRDNREFQKDALRFKSEGGKYVFKYSFSTGYGAVLFGGFEVYTYTETEGEKDQSEVILAETWATTSNNTAPVAGSGWRIYASGAAKTPGQDYNYNGARIFDLGYKNLTKGFYNGMGGNTSTDYIIYGEGEPYTDAEGNVTEEPTLHLSAGKVQFTYYCTNWKTASQTQTFELINKETGEVVYTQSDVITPNPGGDRNASIEAQKVQFTYYVPETADYLLKFYTDGEGFVGNIKLETVSSVAVQCKNLLKEAIAAAQEELDTANANDEYAGDTRDALDKAIKDYTTPDFHTRAEYNAAIADLEKLQKAMAARRSNINAYASALQTVVEAVENCKGTKYEGLECYQASAALVESYATVEAKSLNDEELAQCVTDIKLNGNMLNYMVNEIVPSLLTKQIADLAAKIVSLDETTAEDEAILAAGNAISDDQLLVKGLKLMLAGKIYEKIGNGIDLFNEYDEEYDINTPITVELPLIQNPMFYTTIIADGTNYEGKADSYPGWNIDIQACNVMSEFGWVANDGKRFNTVHPYTDAIIATTWGDCDITVSQQLSELPVGKFNFTLATMDRSYVDKDESGAWVALKGETTSCVYVQQGEERTEKIFDITNIGQYYGQTDTDIEEVNVTAGENLTGSVEFGAHMTTHGGTFASIDNAKIYMTGKADGFDYKAAAEKVLAEAANGIELQERTDEPVSVEIFDLNGRRAAAANGISIRVERYADGYTVVKKVIK